jgi:asparagine synthase (glutamine-hydrolysing)
MTILAGAFSLDPDSALPDELCESLRAAVSRVDGEPKDEIRTGALFLVKVDIGAFGASGLQRGGDGSLTAVAGEPLIDAGEAEPLWNREQDLALLHPLLEGGDWQGLARCRGTFCGLHYSAPKGTLALFVDKVGVRPLYLWVGPRFVVFASALRILEAVKEVPKRFDVRGVTEIAAFEYPLADRTAYLGIRMLKAGEVVRVADGRAESHRYWRWDDRAQPGTSHAEALTNTYAAFMAAINRRQRQAPVAAAFLSGGLDSRVIVGGLHASGCEVHTVNYAPDGTQDQVFAKMLAEKLGIAYSQLHTNADNVQQGYRKSAVAGWIKDVFSKVNPSGRPPMFWSGDGGSVALGHVYLSRAIVGAMKRGARDDTLTLMKRSVPGRILKQSVREQLVKLPIEGTIDELDEIDCADPGRAFHLYLMLNDQRRHLSQHFEDIDIDRIEFQLPFFDADFLDTILRSPCEPFLEHRFYIDWLDQFPNGLASIPWQAYPGHVPCPVPSPADLKLQWTAYYGKKMFRKMTLATAEQGSQALASASFPDHLISRGALRLAVWITRLGWRNYGYLIRTACAYQRYWAVCDASARQAPAERTSRATATQT